MNYIYLKKHN